jgi:hypothetical protein
MQQIAMLTPQIAAPPPMFRLTSLLLPPELSYQTMPIGPKDKPIASEPPETAHNVAVDIVI